MNELLAKGASVHVRNNSGHTPLFFAAETDHKENVQILRSTGAHIHPQEISNLKSLGTYEQSNGVSAPESESTWELALSPTQSH